MLNRHLSNILISRYKQARSVYIYGPRQSGKTTLARSSFPDLPYVTLEDPDVLDYAISDPRSFLQQFKEGGIIDEPQRYPDLFSYLQSEIDLNNKKFILSSSQNFLMMESISQSLAGRISILNLLPLSKAEIEHKPWVSLEDKLMIPPKEPHSIDTLWPLILKGGYPELYRIPGAMDYWFSDYVRTYLERDVRRLIKVEDLSIFQRFLKLCAGRSGHLLNYANLASDTGISETTCRRWLGLLEQSGLVMLLKPYHNNFQKRIVKSPKLYFLDTGLLCHLLMIKTQEHLETHPALGAIVETYTVTEIYKTFLNHGIEPECYFWRDAQKNEVDLLLALPDNQLLPIEIKAGQTIASDWLKPLDKLCTLAKIEKSFLLYGGKQSQQRNTTNIFPLDVL